MSLLDIYEAILSGLKIQIAVSSNIDMVDSQGVVGIYSRMGCDYRSNTANFPFLIKNINKLLNNFFNEHSLLITYPTSEVNSHALFSDKRTFFHWFFQLSMKANIDQARLELVNNWVDLKWLDEQVNEKLKDDKERLARWNKFYHGNDKDQPLVENDKIKDIDGLIFFINFFLKDATNPDDAIRFDENTAFLKPSDYLIDGLFDGALWLWRYRT